MASGHTVQPVTCRTLLACTICAPQFPATHWAPALITSARPCRLCEAIHIRYSSASLTSTFSSPHVRHSYSRLTHWLCTTPHFRPLASDYSQSFAPSLKPYIILMSRSSFTPIRSRRLSKDGSTHSAHLNEQPPPENDTLRPADDEEEICEPLVVTSPGISNSGPPQLPEPHVQESTSNNSPKGASTTEAQKVVLQDDQLSPGEM
ncbi:uncharacterized protein BJ212DRAFT_539844 [Suillus subaureus]|uniref:Uncharacterized protein n=1 Tax=Suillus subaureus TaxID=48587 RepID=A0A9P7JIH8_9AGAM|nr:uncharacterized protein BJ212DRAFT_539844 [Suillus subaureus]KAG1824636.1 hypothetical protein BJ212DRAFT_539844 [Suillus subaureus]